MALPPPVQVLIAPLDWGLGHATRCIPVIKAFTDQGATVIVAAGGAQKALLETEFPDLEFLEIGGYGIRYSASPRGLIWGLIIRIPAILKNIRRENDWLKTLCHRRKLDLIISDNRYGFHHEKIPGIFITHQLYIQSGWGWVVNRVLLTLNRYFIERFSECWIPDFQHPFSLAGILSHPPRFPAIPVKYMGLLSRFNREERKGDTIPLLVMISGPEPQRTAFENLLLSALETFPQRTLFLRGLPGDHPEIKSSNKQVEIRNHLKSEDLQQLLNASEKVICRAGYSSVMDLARLRKKVILIPTPGQPEQEYLGKYLSEKKWALVVRQTDLNLKRHLQMLEEGDFEFPEMPEPLFSENLIRTFLDGIIGERP
jgi:uncharacterized protein (TIGR00661 family)